MNNIEFKFTPENIERINKEIAKYLLKKPAVMATLYIGQEQNGYISNEVIKEVATILEMTSEEVLGVVTFYTMYFQKPMGKNHIQVCTNVSCMLRGGYEIWNQVKEKLGIDNMNVTQDQKFSLEEAECMGSCGTAPMLAVNEDYYENLTKEKVEELINSLKNTN